MFILTQLHLRFLLSSQYRVYITPRTGLYTYGDEIDVSDYVLNAGVGSVIRSIDYGDYDFGVYAFGDIEIKALNANGYFNELQDHRSIFRFSRDLAKVRVVFSNEVETITFRGLINEEATRTDLENDQINFRVLSLDSVLRTTIVEGGTIFDNTMASDAVFAFLNVPDITRALTVDVANISLDYDFNIDDASSFSEISVKDALNLILAASNSVLIVDPSGSVIVRSRFENEDTNVLNLFGKSDPFGRENIIEIFDLNTGKQRIFNSIDVDGTVSTDTGFVEDFGFRQKTFEFPFITDTAVRTDIAETLVEQFKSPKTELKVRVPTSVSKSAKILDRVSVSYPLRKKAIDQFMPIVGQVTVGQVDEALPDIFGSFQISPNLAFKIIEIVDDPSSFTSTMKLRLTDRYVFNYSGNAIVGYAIVGEAILQDGDGPSYNPSILGGALVGNTMVA